MKQLFVALIDFYTLFISPTIRQLLGIRTMCRYSTSCSVYARESLIQYGIIKGVMLAAKRILSCQPFNQAII